MLYNEQSFLLKLKGGIAYFELTFSLKYNTIGIIFKEMEMIKYV